jgi:hypothetical protein
VGTGQSNTWATGTTQNFSGATQIVLPVHGGYTSAGNGELGFDSTYHNWHAYANGGDQYVALFSTGSPPTNGNCAQWAVGGGFYELGQASGPCVVARASGAYTTATSDSFTVTGATASSHCVFSPTNSIAASSSVVGYVSSVGANTVTITHAATVASGGTINIICTPN